MRTDVTFPVYSDADMVAHLRVWDDAREWSDTTTPRTDRPVRFYWGQVGEETGEWERDAAFRRSMVF